MTSLRSLEPFLHKASWMQVRWTKSFSADTKTVQWTHNLGWDYLQHSHIKLGLKIDSNFRTKCGYIAGTKQFFCEKVYYPSDLPTSVKIELLECFEIKVAELSVSVPLPITVSAHTGYLVDTQTLRAYWQWNGVQRNLIWRPPHILRPPHWF